MAREAAFRRALPANIFWILIYWYRPEVDDFAVIGASIIYRRAVRRMPSGIRITDNTAMPAIIL